mmetsp:Transcript_8560/g.28164  ORF Transcript_8560/g.28164 Transcript_8560/m.28164 type:complete len:314 (-) Transcript_8560:47-988(-)
MRNTHVLDTVVHTRGCPNNSWVQEVERIMSVLNLALYGAALERPPIDECKYPGAEVLFRRSKGVADLRKEGVRHPALVKGHLEAMKPVNDLLLERFTQLALKGWPFQRGPEVSEADADTFFNSKIDNFFAEAAPEGLRRRGVTRALLNTTRAAAFIETHVTGDPYKYEVRKTCWYAQLLSLSRKHEGALPPDDVKELYASYKCEYGCAPPVAPPEVFLAMGRELPRPRKNGAGKYDEFKDCFGQPTPLQLPELTAAPREVVSPAILQKEKLRDVVKCCFWYPDPDLNWRTFISLADIFPNFYTQSRARTGDLV